MGRIRPVRAIDAPWQDGDHVGSDDDKEELGGVPVLLWRGPTARSPRREPKTPMLRVRERMRRLQPPAELTAAPARTAFSSQPSERGEAWELELAMRADHDDRRRWLGD